MHKTYSITLLITFPLIFLSACQNYSLSINQNQVYNPRAIFTGFQLVDATLQRCVDGIIADNLLREAEQVTQIACGPGKIASLQGLEVFNQLQHLGLPNNSLQSLAPMVKLKNIQRLHLANNPISDISPLLQLEELTYVNLEGLSAIPCSQITTLKNKNAKIEVKPPKHCSSNTN